MKKLCAGLFFLASFSVIAQPIELEKEILQEKAAFSLGIQKNDITIVESDRSEEMLTQYFNATYKDKIFQCYVKFLKMNKKPVNISDAVCRPTDGSDLPQ